MKKYYLYITLAIIAILQSCTKDFERINQNPSQFNSPDAEAIFTGVVKATADQMERNNALFFWSYANYFSIDGGTSRYQSGDDTNWQQLYINILSNLNQLKLKYGNDPAYANRINIVNIWECYAYSYLTGIYGPLPYSNAMKTREPIIDFDDENAVYESLLSRLKVASDNIKVSGGDVFAPDVVFNGDLLKWKKFANSLRLKIALRTRKNKSAIADAAIKELMTNESSLMQSANDNAKVVFGTGEGNESFYFIRYVKNTITDGDYPKLNDYLFLHFRSYSDPRLGGLFDAVPAADQYAVTDTLASLADDTLRIVSYKIPALGSPKSPTVLAAWGLIGQSPIAGSTFKNFSKPKTSLFLANRPFIMMDYADVCFMMAEAKTLNLGGTKTAEQYYIDGVNSNFNNWGLSPAAATAYLNTNGIKFSTQGKGFNYYTGIVNADIPLDNLWKIYYQRWINYYPDGAFDAWALQRQTQSLNLPPHTNPGNIFLAPLAADVPDRWEFPQVERNNNPKGYASAIAKIGGLDVPVVPLQFAATYTHKDWSKVTAFYDPKYIQKWYGQNVENLTAAGIPFIILNKYKKP